MAQDWLDKVARREAQQMESDNLAKRNAETVASQMAGLWRTFKSDFHSEVDRYIATVRRFTIQAGSPADASPSVSTRGHFPAVALKVSCCGSGAQLDYVYTVAANHDATPKTYASRLIVYAKGQDVFMKTPEGEELPTTKDAVGYLLDRFDQYARA